MNFSMRARSLEEIGDHFLKVDLHFYQDCGHSFRAMIGDIKGEVTYQVDSPVCYSAACDTCGKVTSCRSIQGIATAHRISGIRLIAPVPNTTLRTPAVPTC